MSIEFVLRLAGMVVFALLGVQISSWFGPARTQETFQTMIVLTLAGAAIGLLVAPYLTLHPFNFIKQRLQELSIATLIAGVLGLVIGLSIAALLHSPLSSLPAPYGSVTPVLASLVFGYIGAGIAVMRQTDITSYIKPTLNLGGSLFDFSGQKTNEDKVLVDTSVIIDGRIADISNTGFIRNVLLVPRFVLNELQYIADSADRLRRGRGRRGLEILKQLQDESHVPVQITDVDIDGVRGVDEKLVMLAKQLDCPIMTNDYNLNSVAKLQGIVVLNINDLANAVKTVILPEETINVRVIQEGKEPNQGVAYLNDGTMIVIKDGKQYIDKQIDIKITRVLQTSAGRMIFAELEHNGS